MKKLLRKIFGQKVKPEIKINPEILRLLDGINEDGKKINELEGKLKKLK